MSDNSPIEWTDATWNPVTGCSKVSPGCKHCYAETFAERWRGVTGHPYEQGFDLRLVPDKLGEPQHWKQPKRVFVNSMSDLFQDGVADDFIAGVWRTMSVVRRHTYQILTKRADRMREILPRLVATFGVLPNVWLGVSVENQHFADERIPVLLHTPAAVRFVSAEPLLGPVDLNDVRPGRDQRGREWLQPIEGWQTFLALTGEIHTRIFGYEGKKLDWVIIGGESGPGARPCDVAWARSIVQQCQRAGVPVFVKQLGAHVRDRNDAGFDGSG